MFTLRSFLRSEKRRYGALATKGFQSKFCDLLPSDETMLFVAQLGRRIVWAKKGLGRGARINVGTNPAELPMRFDLLAPAHNVVRIESDTKHIGRNESKL